MGSSAFLLALHIISLSQPKVRSDREECGGWTLQNSWRTLQKLFAGLGICNGSIKVYFKEIYERNKLNCPKQDAIP
jgi:hypothetical protein